jgi:CHAD domain-containing protein
LKVFLGPEGTALERRGKRLQDALGRVRDVEVEREWLSSVLRDAPELRDLLKREDRLLALQAKALARILAGWITPSAAAAILRRTAVASPGGRRVRLELMRRLEQVDRRLRALGHHFDARKGHRARIAVKKLRYLAELAQPAFPAASSKLVRTLKKPQKDLGDFHDAGRWASRWKQESRRTRGDRQNTASWLAGWAKRRMKRARSRVEKDVQNWRRAHVAAYVRALLDRPVPAMGRRRRRSNRR